MTKIIISYSGLYKIDEEEDNIYGDKRSDVLPPEFDSKEKIRKKIEEIEQSQGKKFQSVWEETEELRQSGKLLEQGKKSPMLRCGNPW